MIENFEVDGQNSKFNAGFLQMQRIHVLQERINLANMNMLSFNSDFGVYNYELKFKSCCQLFKEACPKLSEKEKKTGIRIAALIQSMLESHPINEEKNGLSSQKKVVLNKSNWKIHREQLEQFEIMVKDYLDKHNFNSPPEDESALF